MVQQKNKKRMIQCVVAYGNDMSPRRSWQVSVGCERRMVCSPSTKAHVDKMYLCRIKSNGTSKSQTRGLQTRLYETSTKLGGNATQIKWGIYCTQERIYTFRGLCHSHLLLSLLNIKQCLLAFKCHASSPLVSIYPFWYNRCDKLCCSLQTGNILLHMERGKMFQKWKL